MVLAVLPGHALQSQLRGETRLAVHIGQAPNDGVLVSSSRLCVLKEHKYDSIEVRVTPDNRRFISDPTCDAKGMGGDHSVVQCTGKLPASCVSADVCDMLKCPCQQDTSELLYGPAVGIMTEVLPMCLSAQDSFRVLLIGVAGGAVPMHILNACPKSTSVESVELNPRMLDIATSLFGLNLTRKGSLVEINDGGDAVRERVLRGDKFNVVIVDAFASCGLVPESCKSPAFLKHARELLQPQGKLIQNIGDEQLNNTLRDYRSVFEDSHVKVIKDDIAGYILLNAQTK